MGLLDDAIREHLELQRRRGADPADIERAEREALGPVRRAPEESEGDFPETAVVDRDADFEDDEGDWEEPFAGPDARRPHAAQTVEEDDPFADEVEDEDFFVDEPSPLAQDQKTSVYEPFEDEEDPVAGEAELPALEPEPPTPPRRRFGLRRRPTEEAVEPEGHSGRDEPPAGADETEAPDRAEPGIPQPHPASPPPAPAHAGQETVEYDVTHELGKRGEEPAEKAGDDDVLEETPEFLQDTPEHDRLWFEQRPPRDFDFDG
jgi:hypothetical protein